jgi:hypothetical protein
MPEQTPGRHHPPRPGDPAPSAAPAGLLTLTEIEALAREAHARQTDKSGRPYTEHLAAVAEGVRLRGGTDSQIAAAWLHDSVEDGALSRAWLDTAPLPAGVREMVLALTKRPGETLESYTARVLATPGAVLVKESDLAHNSDPARLADLDRPTATRLAAKYARTRALLGLSRPAPE